jgi:glyoxylase-like metal-dependent hydrolase (beta-lactamase superfamily II)
MKITPEIYQIENIRGANSYLVMNKDGILLIDTGLPGNGEKIIKYVEGLGKKSEDVKYIILTHADPDHSGSAAELKKLTNAKLAIHEVDAPRISGEKPVKEVKGAKKVLFSLILKSYKTVKPDILLKERDKIDDFKVVYTPGHTQGSISLYGKEVLFSGDAVLGDKNGNVAPPSPSMTFDLPQAWKSVEKISNLDFEILLPGHGKVVLKNASKKVKELLKNKKVK